MTRYTCQAGEDVYALSFTRYRDLSRARMADGIHGLKRAAAKLAHFDGAYLRFSGEIRIVHTRGDQVIDEHSSQDAIWELMYFGHARK